MSDPYYRFFPGDYMRDTAGLSLVEDGAYRRMLDHYYSEESLPSDPERLFRICRAFTEEERKAVLFVAGKYFTDGGGTLVNARAKREIASRREYLAGQSRKGKMSAEKRWGSRQKEAGEITAVITAAGTEGVTEGQPDCNLPSPSPSPSPLRSKGRSKPFPDATASGPTSGKGNGKGLGRKAKKEYPTAVLDVYQAYVENIVAIPAKKADALRNIAARIKEGYALEQLTGAVERYFEERQGNPDALPYHANNFFGQKAYFLGYLPDPGPGSPEAAHA